MISKIKDKEWFGEVFYSSIEGVLLIDDQGIILKANPSTERMFGYYSDELLGKKILDLIPKKSRKTQRAHWENYVNKPKICPMNLLGLRKDTTEFPLRISLSPSFIKGKSVVIAYIIDITRRTIAERELNTKATWNKAILQAIPDMIFIINGQGVYLDVHAPDLSLLAVSIDEIVGKKMCDFLPKDNDGTTKVPVWLLKIQRGSNEVLLLTTLYGILPDY